MARRDLGEGTRLAAAAGAWIIFEDEAGQNLRPPRARTWARRGRTPVVTVSGKGSGRVPVAGLVCLKPGARGHLFCRVRIHHGRKGERRSMSGAGYAGLITAAHQELQAPVILAWDYVARNIIPVVCPAVLCGRRRVVSVVAAGERLGGAAAGRIMLRAERCCFLYPREQRGSYPDAGDLLRQASDGRPDPGLLDRRGDRALYRLAI